MTMAKSDKRKKMHAEKKMRKAAAMRSPGFVSNYGKKHAYLTHHGLWGFDVPEPKPWK